MEHTCSAGLDAKQPRMQLGLKSLLDFQFECLSFWCHGFSRIWFTVVSTDNCIILQISQHSYE
jgi:hypothetical protein